MSNNQLYPLTVQSVQPETANSVSVSFIIPDALKPLFTFKAGQYLALESLIKGEQVRRSYSLCSAPYENVWKVGIKKVPGGLYSTYANEVLRAGDTIDVLPPSGNFTVPKTEKTNPHYVAFTAGSGITPILSIIKDVLNTNPQATFTLFYGNRNMESIMFREDLESLKSTHLTRLSIYHVLSREKLGSPLFFGRLDAGKCKSYCEKIFNAKEVDGYFLCGPGEMIFSVRDQLQELGVDPSAIHYELFSTEGLPVKQVEEKDPDFDPEKESQIEVKLDGDKFSFRLPYGGKSILDAALSEGADLPFACKGGVCSTCKAKLLKGEINMDINYALEKDELEAGYILTCQSHPRTESIEIDFDV